MLGDRAQAPSGAGYALQNRLAMSRALPEIHRTLPVERLAGFFQALRSEFSSYAQATESRVAVLTPGPLNETYFEHAFLARYLGFLLAEGADLTVRDDSLYVRTVSGLKKLEMVWRRLDADFADPLELNPRSQLGVAGLVHAIRSGTVTLANALARALSRRARFSLSCHPSPVRGLGGTSPFPILRPGGAASLWSAARSSQISIPSSSRRPSPRPSPVSYRKAPCSPRSSMRSAS